MPLEFVVCPVCKQRLALQSYVIAGTSVVCTNCETRLRITGRRPLKVDTAPIEESYNANDRPESYG